MSESKVRQKRHQRFLEVNPDCYFCGGANPASEIDHVPPRACFPDGYAPDGFEFPVCKACNQGTKKQDQIFGLYSMLLDFDESKTKRKEDVKKLRKLKQGVINNYPEALPDATGAYPVRRVGSIITPTAVAMSVPTTPALREAVEVMSKKLTHALYFREAGKILASSHEFLGGVYQPQRVETQDLTDFLLSLLPKSTVGKCAHRNDYGDRFRYVSGYKEREDFFLYAAQFGHGIILWGIVCGPGFERPSSGALGSAEWRNGACGPGALGLPIRTSR